MVPVVQPASAAGAPDLFRWGWEEARGVEGCGFEENGDWWVFNGGSPLGLLVGVAEERSRVSGRI